MTTLTSPHDLIAAIPFLIGYHPVDSLVVVSIKDNCIGMAMRVDYPIDLPIAAYDLLASHLHREGSTGALLVAYVPSGRSDGEAVLSDLAAALHRIDLKVDESLLIQDGRFRSTMCSDVQCCPPNGRDVPAIDSSRIALEHVVAGRAMPFANLEALTESISALVIADDEKWVARVSKFAVPEKSDDLTKLQRDGATAVIDLAGEFALGRGGDDLELIARVIGRLSDIQVRDFALGTHTEEDIDNFFLMWRHLMRMAPPGFVAPIASLFAALAYESGDGALAHRALDRALADSNGYSLALLLRRVFTAGWPPESFAAMRRELHPKVCAGIFGEELPPGFGL
ncbi:DUF4192 domain-containing protein [Actinobacteria bacterium IMCC26103]|nr:DUF4192 domain-containing protein [Actinobacteria bacterium IMCC26103]